MSSSPDNPARRTRRERRAHARHRAADLATLRSSRLKHGPNVQLVDLSAGGALIEADVQLKPGTSLSLELEAADHPPTIVTMRVLRCEVASIRAEATIYRGACAFARPLDWLGLLVPPIAPLPDVREFIGLDASLRKLADRCRPGSGTLATADVLQVLRGLELRAGKVEEPAARPLADLLPMVTMALERNDPADVVLAAIEARLRAAVPYADISLTDAPLPPNRSGPDALVLRPEHAADLSCVLSIQLPAGTALDDAQMRLMRATMDLCSLLDAGGIRRSTPGATPSLWQKLVVRYKDGRLVKGFSHDFHPTRSQFAIWPSVNAAEHEGIVVPVSVLKAVFFVRDFRGDASYIEEKTFDQATHGRKVEVTFFDNEVLVGTTLSYRPDGQGFFLIPADPLANNIRVFVVTSAVRHVRFLGGSTEAPPAGALQLAPA
jgi:hypothetical protein